MKPSHLGCSDLSPSFLFASSVPDPAYACRRKAVTHRDFNWSSSFSPLPFGSNSLVSVTLTALWGVFCSEEVKNCTHKKSFSHPINSLSQLYWLTDGTFFHLLIMKMFLWFLNVNYCGFLLNTELTPPNILKVLYRFWSLNSGMWHPDRGHPEVSISTGKSLDLHLGWLIDGLEEKMWLVLFDMC